jgi:hypothetical protein
VAREEAPDRAEAERQTLLAQRLTQRLDGDVGRLLQHREDGRRVGLDPTGFAVAAHRLGLGIALLALAGPPAADARRAHSEPLGGLPVCRATCHRGQNPNSKIERQGFRHACRPPSPQTA